MHIRRKVKTGKARKAATLLGKNKKEAGLGLI